MRLTNDQKSVISSLGEVTRVIREELGGIIFTIDFTRWNEIKIVLDKKELEWTLLERLKGITDKRNVGWSVGIDGSGGLYIKLKK